MSDRILIVDDNEVDREAIRRRLGRGTEVIEATTGGDGLEQARGGRPACVLLDHRLPDAEGLELVARFVELGVPVVMLTGQGNERVAVEAMKRGARDYLVKDDLTGDVLRRAVRHAVDTTNLESRIARQRRELERHVEELAVRTEQLENANAALRGSEYRLRVVMEQLPAIVWTTDAELHYRSMAGAACRALGFDTEHLVGTTVTDHQREPEAVDAHRRALAGSSVRYDLPWDDRTLQAHVEPLRREDGEIEGVIGFALDVTQSRHMADQLRQAQKMEAVGKLAGGVAHDFNNLLTAIRSFGEFALESLHTDDPVREDLRQILRATERATGLTRQLLAFSRHQRVEPRSLDIGKVVNNLEKMLARIIHEDVELQTHTAEALWPTRIDPGSLEQVIVNLVVNARDAMPHGGRLVIESENVHLYEGDPRLGRRGLLPGDYVMLAVTDTGVGIPPELQECIFEPFFTTKEVGEGTGLGLSTCYGIVHQADGHIWVYSEPDHGTTFKVVLPRCEEEGTTSTPLRAAPRSLHGTERILVVEDDEQVRALVVRALSRHGYDVVAADNGGSALLISERRRDAFDLLLTDVVMPHISGPELATRLEGMQPRMRVVYMSGYTARVATQQRLLPEDAAILAKPFSPQALALRVRELLDEERNRPADTG